MQPNLQNPGVATSHDTNVYIRVYDITYTCQHFQYCAFRLALAFCLPLLSLVVCLSYTSSARLAALPCFAFNLRLINAALPLNPN